MLSPVDDCHDCHPSHLRRSLQPLRPALALASAPFAATFLLVALFAWQRLFPLLSGNSKSAPGSPLIAKRPGWMPRKSATVVRTWLDFVLDRAAAITFSTTIALSAVLAELIFCEISDTLNPAARSYALEITLSVLLSSLVVVIPALEIHSLIAAAGLDLKSASTLKAVFAICLDLLGLALWLASFWWVGRTVLRPSHNYTTEEWRKHGLSEGSLERIGIIGISLMASLAGFAAVSSLWQTFGAKAKKVTDTDIQRKQAGLEATMDLLAAKESRLRALEHKLSDLPRAGLMTRMLGSIRGNPDTEELASLQMEISGLETMQVSLTQSLTILRNRKTSQQQASTPVGRVCFLVSYLFSFYCLYRISATLVATLRRWWHPAATFASTDPINNVLALVATYWDPTIDKAAWSRQISFLLSGVMLLASFNAVLQTVLLFSRFTPTRLLQSAQQNLALLVSQICATYVVSSALLLRSNLPKDMGTVIEDALGAPLDTAFVERWFEGWFLGACAVTALGIWVGKNVVGSAEWDDDYRDDGVDLESGKRSKD